MEFKISRISGKSIKHIKNTYVKTSMVDGVEYKDTYIQIISLADLMILQKEFECSLLIDKIGYVNVIIIDDTLNMDDDWD